MKLQEGNVFTGVCLYKVVDLDKPGVAIMGVGIPSPHWVYLTLRHWHLVVATKADSTHSTEMLSCLLYLLFLLLSFQLSDPIKNVENFRNKKFYVTHGTLDSKYRICSYLLDHLVIKTVGCSIRISNLKEKSYDVWKLLKSLSGNLNFPPLAYWEKNQCNHCNGVESCIICAIPPVIFYSLKFLTLSCLRFSLLFSENAEPENTMQLIKALSDAGILFTSEVCVDNFSHLIQSCQKW